ncbi:hypothetical protein [Spirosoma utsteinense]|uniref:hypothetical protein n=1 Tax=Spirosoma utsteinense TaxID=2585773 RepID=UPI001644B023|nr:hypothetical protein [Spirosoma utsteinense]MBC3785734.1 hypothetical protein [Spirosoma utsteinense]
MSYEDKLIELGRLCPHYANMVQEFKRLAELSQHPSCTKHLEMMVEGLLREATNEAEERDVVLEPIGVKSATRIQTVDVNGSPTSIWHTNSFGQRLDFLRNGRIAVVYPSAASIVPLCLRLDVDKLVTITKEE